jgi:hypothetical protein
MPSFLSALGSSLSSCVAELSILLVSDVLNLCQFSWSFLFSAIFV